MSVSALARERYVRLTTFRRDGTSVATPVVRQLLRQKYGFQKRGLDAFNGLMRRLARRPPAGSVYLEIVESDDARAPASQGSDPTGV